MPEDVTRAAVTPEGQAPFGSEPQGERPGLPVGTRVLILVLFFISGASGLIYEVLWARMPTLSFGVTVLAAATVMAAFMGGLALGSYLFGRWADRWG